MSKKKKKSGTANGGGGKDTMWGRCPECDERVPPAEMPQHAKNCCTDTEVRWVWGEAKGRGINEDVEANVEALINLLGGGEEYQIRNEKTKNNLMEVIITVVDPDTNITINILIRYSEHWGEPDLQPSKAFYLGLQRTSSRVSRRHFEKLSDILCDTATNEAGDDLSCWVWNLTLQFRERFISYNKEDKLTFHDAAMLPKSASNDSYQHQQSVVGDDDFVSQQPSVDEPFFSDVQQDDNTNTEIQDCIQNIRTKRTTNSVFFREDGMWGGNSPNFRSAPDEVETNENGDYLSEEKLFADSDSQTDSSSEPTAGRSPMTPQSDDESSTESSSDGGKLGDRNWGKATTNTAATTTTTEESSTESDDSTDSSDSSSGGKLGDRWDRQAANANKSSKHSNTSSSCSSSSDSSGCKLGDRWERNQAALKQQALSGDSSDGQPVTRQKRRKTKKKKKQKSESHTFSTNSPRTVRSAVVTPQEQRAQVALRYLINSCTGVDEPIKDAIIAQLEDFEFLSSNMSADPTFTKSLSELVTQGTFSAPATLRHPQDFKKISWFKDNFVIIKQLGEGGQGRVYQVQNKTDGLYYAVKRVELRGKRDDIDRYVRAEVRTLARLRHPYIVRYFAAWFEKVVQKAEKPLRRSGDTCETFPSCQTFTSSFGDGEETEELSEEDIIGSDLMGSNVIYQSKRYCYLQMEYCYQDTLRQSIDKRIFTTDQEGLEYGFKILWQLLQCVDFLHSQGVIHRDLKPENVFFDIVKNNNAKTKYFAGDIKVGDFGFATKGSDIQLEDEGTANHSSGIGTPLYCAPEQMLTSDYNCKVDEYSLGIIAYEMFSGFASSHERHQGITGLRKTGKIPTDWSGHNIPAKLGEVIEALATINPSDRATASDIIKLDILPKPRQQEDTMLAVQLLADQRESTTSQVIERCLANPNTLNGQDWLYSEALDNIKRLDKTPIHNQSLAMQDRSMGWVRETLTDAFKKVGASRVEVPLTIPANSMIKDQHLMKVINEDGTIMVTPYNPSVAFARYVSWPKPTLFPVPLRRYSLDKVLRGSICSEVASFDILTAHDSYQVRMSADAEVMSILAGILNPLPLPNAKWCIRINHSSILTSIAEVCGTDVESLFHRNSSLLKHKKGDEFSKNTHLDPALVGKLLELVGQRKTLFAMRNNSNTYSSVFTQIAGLLGVKSLLQHKEFQKNEKGILAGASLDVKENAARALHELQSIEQLLLDIDFKQRYPRVEVEFDGSYHKDQSLYSGVLYTVGIVSQHEGTLTSSKGKPGRREFSVVGIGGRYDKFMQTLRNHYSALALSDKDSFVSRNSHTFQVPASTCCTGFNLSLTDIFEKCMRHTDYISLSAQMKSHPNHHTLGPSMFVHVCIPQSAYNAGLLLRVCIELRECGIPCDYQLEPNILVPDLQDYCRQNFIPWLLLLPAVTKNTHDASVLKFKLKNLSTGGLRKDTDKHPTEHIIDSRISGIGKAVVQRLEETAVTGPQADKGHNYHNTPGTSHLTTNTELEIYGADGKKKYPDATMVKQLFDSSFSKSLGARHCYVSLMSYLEVRNWVSQVYSSGLQDNKTDPKFRQLADWTKARQTTPVLVIFSEPDRKFEIILTSNIRRGGGHEPPSRNIKHKPRKGKKAYNKDDMF